MGTSIHRVLKFMWVFLFWKFIATVSTGTYIHRLLVIDGYVLILQCPHYLAMSTVGLLHSIFWLAYLLIQEGALGLAWGYLQYNGIK